MRSFSFLAGVVCSLAASGCGGSPTTGSLGANSCGPAYTFQLKAGNPVVGSCAGLLPARPPRVAIRVGDHIRVQITHEQDGSLDYPVPTATGPAVALASRIGATVMYVGRAPGRSELIGHHTRFCPGAVGPTASCAVLTVSVTP